VHQFNARFTRRVRGIAPDALAMLGAYDFPGNVRELENLIERAFALGARDEIRVEDLPALAAARPAADKPGEPLPALGTALAEVERQLIVRALQLHGNDRERAARALSISTRTFY